MTAQDLQTAFDHKRNILWEMREDGVISIETYEATLNKVKDETFFAMSVISTIDNINEPTARVAA